MQRKELIAGNKNFLNNVIIIYLFIFLFVFLIVTTGFITKTISADSNSYYVSPTGNNGNNGLSPENAWLTIEYAMTKVSSGDTVYIMAGVYTPVNGQIIIANKNTPGSWFTIRNYNNDLVIIDGTNCPTTNYLNATIEIKNSQYVRLTGLTINHSYNGGITLMTKPISFIKIDNCTISNCSNFAFKSKNGLNNITFEYNYVYNNFLNWSAGVRLGQETLSFENVTTFSINNNTLKRNRAEIIDLKGGCKRGVVCFNEINNSGGYLSKLGQTYYGGPGIMIDSRGVTHNISIYNNKIYGNQSGISCNTERNGHYEYIFIYNNIINISLLGGGTSLSGRQPMALANTGGSTDVFHHIYIYSNTIRTGAGNLFDLFLIGSSNFPNLNKNNLHDIYLVNNIFYTASTNILVQMFNFYGIELDDNIVTVNSNSFYRTTGTLSVIWNTTTYYTSSPEYWGDQPLFTNQQFVNSASDLHLQASSPCIDAGTNVLVPGFDFDDVSRPQGSDYDIGAFEFSSENDITPPQISAMSILTSNPLDTNPLYGWINVSCTVTDNVAVSSVMLRIHAPGGSWNNVSMTSRTAGKYYYRTTTEFSTTGNYSYSIRATDTSGNPAILGNMMFSMPPNWDINNDGRCSILDLVLVSNQYDITGSQGWVREDVDNNGETNVLDINLVSNHFGEDWYT